MIQDFSDRELNVPLNLFTLSGTFDVNLNQHNWDILKDLWKSGSIRFYKDLSKAEWVIEERIQNELVFKLTRNLISLNRNTQIDKYGLLGLSLINPLNDSVIITEGVSDYFTVKLNNPSLNVLGVANLGGSFQAKKIIVNLFNYITICADSDATGYKNACNWKVFLESFNKKAEIVTPDSPFKDVTDNFIFNLKVNAGKC